MVGSFGTAQDRAFDTIYVDSRVTFYCDCSYDDQKQVDAIACGYEPRLPLRSTGNVNQRTRRIEWEPGEEDFSRGVRAW